LTSGLQATNDAEVVVACNGGDWTNHLDALGVSWLNVPLFPSTPMNVVLSFFALRRFAKKRRINLIHSHHRFSSLVGRLVACSLGIPFVCTVHDLTSGNRLITSWALGNTITVFSQAVESHLIEIFNIKKEYIRKIPMGSRPAADLSIGQVQKMKSGLGFALDVPLIGFVGRLVSDKGPDLFLRAVPIVLNRFPNARFCFVGDGVMKNDLGLWSENLGVRESVTSLGGREDVPSLIACFDFVVIPSLREGFGLVALESLAQGKPVIASRVGGLPELVQHEQNGLLIPPGQPIAIADAIIRLISDKDELIQMGVKAHEGVTGQFSREAMLEEVATVYELAMARQQQKRALACETLE